MYLRRWSSIQGEGASELIGKVLGARRPLFSSFPIGIVQDWWRFFSFSRTPLIMRREAVPMQSGHGQEAAETENIAPTTRLALPGLSRKPETELRRFPFAFCEFGCFSMFILIIPLFPD
jgi:hypothetical protein